MVNKSDWIWMPHAGHFIMAHYCRFKLCTYLGNGFIVSTVGELWPDSQIRKIHAKIHETHIEGKGDEWDYNYMQKFGFEDLGYNRKYETMVFKAQKSDNDCCPYEAIITGGEKEMQGYNKSEDAYAGHLSLCEKWSKKK